MKISIYITFCGLLINKIFFFPISSAYLVHIFNDVKSTEILAIILSDWSRERFYFHSNPSIKTRMILFGGVRNSFNEKTIKALLIKQYVLSYVSTQIL